MEIGILQSKVRKAPCLLSYVLCLLVNALKTNFMKQLKNDWFSNTHFNILGKKDDLAVKRPGAQEVCVKFLVCYTATYFPSKLFTTLRPQFSSCKMEVTFFPNHLESNIFRLAGLCCAFVQRSAQGGYDLGCFRGHWNIAIVVIITSPLLWLL